MKADLRGINKKIKNNNESSVTWHKKEHKKKKKKKNNNESSVPGHKQTKTKTKKKREIKGCEVSPR